MADKKVEPAIKEILPKQGLLHFEDEPSLTLCKPKLMPLKTLTLEKLEKMQREAEIKAKEENIKTSEQ